jgi:hypothetical protein
MRTKRGLQLSNHLSDAKEMRSNKSGYDPYNSGYIVIDEITAVDWVKWATPTHAQTDQPSIQFDGPSDDTLEIDIWAFRAAPRRKREPSR